MTPASRTAFATAAGLVFRDFILVPPRVYSHFLVPTSVRSIAGSEQAGGDDLLPKSSRASGTNAAASTDAMQRVSF
jgi:hypothetical protein